MALTGRVVQSIRVKVWFEGTIFCQAPRIWGMALTDWAVWDWQYTQLRTPAARHSCSDPPPRGSKGLAEYWNVVNVGVLQLPFDFFSTRCYWMSNHVVSCPMAILHAVCPVTGRPCCYI